MPAVISALWMAFLYKDGQDPSRVYYGTDTRLFSLLIGAFLGVQYSKNNKRKNILSNYNISIAIFILCILSTITLYTFLDGQNSFTYRGGMFLATLIFAVLIQLCANSQLPVGKWLDIKLLSWIGERSYEVYLWMYPVIYFFDIKKWNGNFIFSFAQIILIIALSVWLHEAVFGINKRKHVFRHKRVQKKQLTYEEVKECIK